MGHSFGAATALYSGCNDKRITGHVILLDPWFFPLPDDLNLNNLQKPFLCIKAESFDTTFPHWRNDELMKAIYSGPRHTEILEKSFVCVLKNAGHLSGTDLPFITPMENKIAGMITNTNNVFELYDVTRLLITSFLKEFDVEKFKNKSVLPEKYREILMPVTY